MEAQNNISKIIRVTCYLIDQANGQLILGQKREGIGKGKLVAIGGKIQSGETSLEALKREVLEEVGITVESAEPFATIHYNFPHLPDWNQTVIVHLSYAWTGTPVATEEILPITVNLHEIPYSKMWDDVQIYLPFILQRKKMVANVVYDKNNCSQKVTLEITQ